VSEFGTRLRFHRRECRDPIHGGLLTQSRLGELLGEGLGDAGYSGAAVSDWERGKSKISEDDRLVLVSLVGALYRVGGLKDQEQADALLRGGNYRALDETEADQVFGRSMTLAGGAGPVTLPEGRLPPESWPAGLPAAPGRDHRQQVLLEKVKGFWVTGYMNQAVGRAALLELERQAFPEAVQHPWQNILGRAALEDYRAHGADGILEAFDAADRALLILGAPGVGKTMTLLQLAEGLIYRAEREPAAAVPVILHLASWAEQRDTLEEWIVEELTAKYQIPQRLGRSWLDEDGLVLLLDGFDEVPERLMRGCARAINRFRQTNGLTGLAVCSRLEAYEQMGQQLHLGGATVLQPLSDEQIDHYLAAAGPGLAPVRAAVRSQSPLREVARSPLALSVMAMAYRRWPAGGAGVAAEPAGGAEGLSLKRLFDRYIERMFARRQPDPRYSQTRTVGWLSWLARQMADHNQSVLLIEQLQPSWLPGRRWRRLYMALSGLVIGLMGGLIIWLLLQLLRQTAPDLPATISARVASAIGVELGRAEFITLLLANVGLGLLVALIQAAYFERHEHMRGRQPLNPRRQLQRSLASGAAVFGLTLTVMASFGPAALALAWAVAEAVMYMTVAYHVYGLSYRREIRVVEALTWSWPSAARGLVVGLILATVAEALDSYLYGNDSIGRTFVTLVTGCVVLGGLRGRRVGKRSRPNEAIMLSIRNALMAAGIMACTMAAIALLVRTPTYALLLGILSGLIALALFGGSTVAKHFLLRLMLWRLGCVPWRLSDFLDHAAGLVLLRKVGGGYVFIHRQMQEHLADRGDGPAPDKQRQAS
jgi:eukaryotic-like serine/threonine-protein kinase